MSEKQHDIPLQTVDLKGSDAPQANDATIGQLRDATPASGRLKIRCPSCHAPIEVAVDTSLTDLTCSSCGSHFSLVDQGQATSMATPLFKLGRFQLIERLGVGGFGTVWKAHDKELDRTVALKIPRQANMSAEDQEKFFREARAAAQLHHPNIVSVHEVGRDGDSIFIVSDFVRGVTLGDWLSGQKLTNREAAELCMKIAEALHHAHEKGVVHRDLKPANIMIDGNGEPHLMDFGLARREVGEVTVTIDGQVLGTPAYMSPEQAVGDSHKADRRSDVYSLGVILFQLLTGELPFRGNARMLVHQVIHDEPPSPRKLDANIKRDLETITLKCLEKQPARRYQAAGDVANELRRHLAGEAIHARPVGQLERSWRLIGRNKLSAALVTTLALTLIAGAVLLGYFSWRFRQQRDLAIKAQSSETELRRHAEQEARSARVANAESVFAKGNALHLAAKGFESRQSYWRAHTSYLQLGIPTLPIDMSLFRSYRTFTEPLGTLSGHSMGLMAVAYAPNNIHLFTASQDGSVKQWDAMRQRQVRTFAGPGGEAYSLAISPDGRRLLCGYSDGKVLSWDIEHGESSTFYEAKGNVRGLSFSPDGRTVALAAWDGDFRILNAQNAQEIHRVPISTTYALGGVAFSADGNLGLVTAYDGSIHIIDVITGDPLYRLTGHTGWAINAVFSPDGRHILSASYDGTARLWDLKLQTEIRSYQANSDPVRCVSFTPDGKGMLTAGLDGVVRLWNVESGELLKMCCGGDSGIRGISVSLDGKRIASAEMDGTAHVWNLESEGTDLEINTPSIRVAPDGRTLLIADQEGRLALYDSSTFKKLRTYPTKGKIDEFAFSEDGTRVLTSSPVTLYDLRTGTLLKTIPDRMAARFADDGSLAISKDSIVWDVETELDIANLHLDFADVCEFRFHPDRMHAISADVSGLLSYWDLNTGRTVWSIMAHGDSSVVYDVGISPDGTTAISGGQDLVLRRWDLGTGQLVGEYTGVNSNIREVDIGYRGDTIFGTDGVSLRAWDTSTGEQLSVGVVLPSSIRQIAAAPLEDCLFVTSASSVIRLDFSIPSRYGSYQKVLGGSLLNGQDKPTFEPSIPDLIEWYAFRGAYDWAIRLVEEWDRKGDVSSLTLARSYWQIGRNHEAAREFRRAIQQKEAPDEYLQLCLQAVQERSEQ